MRQVIYIDVLFAVNLMMNYFILLAVAKVLRRKEKRLRLLLGAALGAVYSLFIFFPQVGFLYSMAMKVLVSLSLVLVSFRYSTVRNLLRLVGTFYIISFLFGGTVYALWYFLTPPGLLVRNGVVYVDIPPVELILIAAGCYIAITLAARFFRKGGGGIYDVEIAADGRVARMRAFLDTGNGLTDVITGAPVIVAEYSAVEKLIPAGLREAFRSGRLDAAERLPGSEWAGKFRLVPYGSVGGNPGLLPAFKPDRLSIRDKGSQKNTDDVLVAVCGRKLCDDGSYSALLSPLLLEQ